LPAVDLRAPAHHHCGEAFYVAGDAVPRFHIVDLENIWVVVARVWELPVLAAVFWVAFNLADQGVFGAGWGNQTLAGVLVSNVEPRNSWI
jgi:hypothetical protein